MGNRFARPAALGLLLATALATPGCELLHGFAKAGNRPTARVTNAQVSDLTLDGLALLFDVEVSNPYEAALPVAALDFTLSSEGQQFVSGTSDVSGAIPARSSRSIPLTAAVEFADLLGVLSSVEPGAVVPYTAEVTLGADAPGVGRISVPFGTSGEIPVPTVPEVSLTRVEWRKLELTEATAVLHLGVDNGNDFPLELRTLVYDLSLAGRRVAGEEVNQFARVRKRAKGKLEVPVTFSPADLGLAVFRLLGGDDAGYRMSGSLGVVTPFGETSLPYESSGRVPFVRE